MFESMEIRKVANGFLVVMTTEDDDTKEYVFDTARKTMRFVKQHLDAKGPDE